MKKNLLLILTLFAAFIMSAPVFGQVAASETLKLGNYDNQKRDGGSWDGFNLQNAPVIFTYNHSGSQILYRPNQLEAMKGKQITSMSFKCFPENCYIDDYKSTMKLYLQEVDNLNFHYDEVGEYYEWIKYEKDNVTATLEFTGDFLTAYENDIEVTFDLSANPYTYSGKTLVATLVNDAPTCIEGSQGAVRFYWIDNINGDSWSSFVFASDDITFEENQAKNNAVKPLENEDKWINAPAVKFEYATLKPTIFSGGEGSSEKPYLISKIQDLSQMDEWTNAGKTAGVYFKLTKDLTEEPFTGIIGSKGGNFRGHFDGENHSVLLNINLPDSSYVGMFGCILGGSLRNLVVTGDVIGDMYVGGALGEAANGAIIENVVNCANISGNYSIGGVIGFIAQQTDAPICRITQCANYGNIIGIGNNYMTIGGVIGDMSGVDGNSVQRIANYGHIKSDSKYAGGLIGNARPVEKIYYGLSLGTYSANTIMGCIGRTQSSTLGKLYYDKQYQENPKANPLQAKTTTELTGDALKTLEDGKAFPEEFWMYADYMYPRLKINGFENTPTAILYASPIILESDNSLSNITNPFAVSIDNNIVWTSMDGCVEFKGGKAYPVALGEDIIVATLGDISREIKVTVTAVSSVEDAAATQNTVTAENGAIVLNLVKDADAAVFDVAGKVCVQETLPEGICNIKVANGVYIVKIGDETYKVCVQS